MGLIVPKTGGGGQSQTPWLQDEDAAGFSLSNLSALGIGGKAPTLGTLATGISAQSLTAGSADLTGQIVITTASASPPTKGNVVCNLVYGTPKATAPVGMFAFAGDVNTIENAPFWIALAFFGSKTIASIFTGQNLIASTNYTVNYLIFGI